MAKMRSDEDFSKCGGPGPIVRAGQEYERTRGIIPQPIALTSEELAYVTSSMKPGAIVVVPPPEWVRVTFKIVTERGNCIECEGKFVSDATFACLQELLRHQVKT